MYKDKEKQRAWQKKYTAEHKGERKEEKKEYRKKHHAKNREHDLAVSKKWYAEHKTEQLAYQKKWHAEHPEERAAAYYKFHYKEPIENKVARLEAQGYKCANQACLKPIDLKTGNQDHNHLTGEVRGVLCGDCNRALGLLRDNAEIAQGITNYRKLFNSLEKVA
jgi:alkaline phosphatase